MPLNGRFDILPLYLHASQIPLRLKLYNPWSPPRILKYNSKSRQLYSVLLAIMVNPKSNSFRILRHVIHNVRAHSVARVGACVQAVRTCVRVYEQARVCYDAGWPQLIAPRMLALRAKSIILINLWACRGRNFKDIDGKFYRLIGW